MSSSGLTEVARELDIHVALGLASSMKAGVSGERIFLPMILGSHIGNCPWQIVNAALINVLLPVANGAASKAAANGDRIGLQTRTPTYRFGTKILSQLFLSARQAVPSESNLHANGETSDESTHLLNS